jgi:hypothetical protein
VAGIIFDDIERSDASPSRHAEGDFAFLNRVAGPFWERTRSSMEEWFIRLPEEAQADVRGRVRSGKDWQFASAFWELYIHESLRREGFQVTSHPDMPDTSAHCDYLARRDGDALYLEATVVGSSEAERAAEGRRNTVYDLLNKLESPDYFLWLDVDEEGPASPSVRQLREDLARWLGTLAFDDVRSAYERGSILAVPTHTWSARGWAITFRPIAKGEEARGKPGIRPVGMFRPGRASTVDDVGQVRSDLENKATWYGRPDLPFVIAAAIESPFFDAKHTMSGALFGREAVQFDPKTLEARGFRQPDGLWRGPGGPRNTRVSGVVAMRSVRPWNLLAYAPVTWHNPWAALRLPDVLPWASARVDLENGQLIESEAVRPSHDILGLPEGWPGPEDPFPDERYSPD